MRAMIARREIRMLSGIWFMVAGLLVKDECYELPNLME